MANVVVATAFKILLVLVCIAFCLGENLSTGVDVDSYVEKMIHSYDVMVFAKSYCPYCRHTRQLLQQLHREHDQSFTLDVVDLDTMEENDGPLIQMELLTKTGQKTVPNVFIRGQHIGGDSDLSELFDSGSLQRLLEGSDETEGQEM